MKIKKVLVQHWNSAYNDLVEWVVLDNENKVIFSSYKKKQALTFIANGGK